MITMAPLLCPDLCDGPWQGQAGITNSLGRVFDRLGVVRGEDLFKPHGTSIWPSFSSRLHSLVIRLLPLLPIPTLVQPLRRSLILPTQLQDHRMHSKAAVLAGLFALADARFGQEGLVMNDIQALSSFGESGQAGTLAGQTPGVLLAGANACAKVGVALLSFASLVLSRRKTDDAHQNV